jgi:hypothetical protein
VEVETEVHDFCQQTVNSLIEQLKESEYYLTNPKLDFLTGLLRKLIGQRQDARGYFDYFFLRLFIGANSSLGLVLVSRTLYAKLMFDYFNDRQDVKVTPLFQTKTKRLVRM